MKCEKAASENITLQVFLFWEKDSQNSLFLLTKWQYPIRKLVVFASWPVG